MSKGNKSKRKPKARADKRYKPKAKKPTMAERADRHELYEEAVQCAEVEIDFVDKTFKALNGRKAVNLREDFCGTANTSCEWVRRRKTNTAIGVDLDPEVQNWGVRHHVAKLGDAKSRIQLVNANVLDVETPKMDIVMAHNFSYWLLKERKQLLRYFERVRNTLVDDGVLFLDSFGGYEAFQELSEKTKNKGFTYVWDQHRFNPVNNEMTCYIHFHFPDGSKLKRAFEYCWRLWTMPEVRDLLEDAGYSRSTVYWEGTDEDTNEGDGVFEPVEVADADPGWIAYIVAQR
ncbi:MAG: class I SAM-dependent methyltransferase [Gammaproteobacteria bacterium]